MKVYSLLLASVLAACGSSPPASKPSGNQTCEAIQADARSTLAKFVDENRACKQDADCVVVGFGASCFDSCTRAIAGDRKADYEAAATNVNAGACATYSKQSCPAHTVPPCAPPSAPTCNAGMCE